MLTRALITKGTNTTTTTTTTTTTSTTTDTTINTNTITNTNTIGIASIELNLACPNIIGKPIVAYDFDQMENILMQISLVRGIETIPFGVKLAPYFDVFQMERAVTIIAKYKYIKYITTINTIGNGLMINIDNECTSIASNHGFGGLGGGFVKHTALANVRKIYETLHKLNRPDIDIIGVGGISKGSDAFEMILCGAKAVQVGTCHWSEGPKCFERIGNELITIMTKKGYKSIEDFRGKLKPYEKYTSKKIEEDESGTTTTSTTTTTNTNTNANNT